MIRKLALGIATVAAITFSAAGAANAQVCAKNSVTGVGKPSITATGARLSARAAWRYAVRSKRGLGIRYALVNSAKRSSQSCRAVGKRTLCRFSATPCRV